MKPMKLKNSIIYGLILAIIQIGVVLLAHFSIVPAIVIIATYVLPFFLGMYCFYNDNYNISIYAGIVLIVSLIIDAKFALIYALPVLAGSISYGLVTKNKCRGTTIVYSVTVSSIIALIISAFLNKWFYGLAFLDTFKTMFFVSKSANSYITFGLSLALFFLEGFLMHFILRSFLKNNGFEVKKTKNPPFWVFILSIAALIACFMPYKEDAYSMFALASTIVFGLPIALYGYQSCEKIIYLLLAQLVVFLAVSLEILIGVYGDIANYVAYIVLFAPPILFACYQLLMNTYSRKQ